MKNKIPRPPLVETLARVPGLKRPVCGTYDRWLRFSYPRFWNWHNAAARRAFEANKPVLNEVQQRVLHDLVERGIAHVPFVELMGDDRTWQHLCGLVQQWLDDPKVKEEECAYREEGHKTAHFKEYIVSMLGRQNVLPWDSPWLKLTLEPRIHDIANYYFGMFTRMYYVDVWNTISLKHDGPLIGAQKWHRDPADIKLLKAFLYFTDVDDSSGAMLYVPYSRRGDRYGHLWTQDAPFDGARPPAKEFERQIPAAEWVSCSFPRGTLVLADTTAFHRGGRADDRNRVLATWAYSSQRSMWPRNFRVDTARVPADLTLAGRHALLSVK